MAGSSLFGSEFFAALAGAGVAGIVSWILQGQNFQAQRNSSQRAWKRERAAREDDRLDEQASTARRVLLKLGRILTDLTQIKDNLASAFRTSLQTKQGIALALRHFSTPLETFAFDSAELQVILMLRDRKTINHLLDLTYVHANYVQNLDYLKGASIAVRDLANSLEITSTGAVAMEFAGKDGTLARLSKEQSDEMAWTIFFKMFDDYPATLKSFSDAQIQFRDRFGADRMKMVWELEERVGDSAYNKFGSPFRTLGL